MAWTTLAEETTLLDTLAQSGRVAVDVVGTSVQGRPIRLVRIGDPAPPEATDRAMLLHVGAQHGNEPAGREALLGWAEHLEQTVDADEVDFLQTHGVLIVPTANPDGVALDQRANADGVDVNRDHTPLETLEARALALVMGRARPAIIVDHHETTSSNNDGHDITFSPPLNPATDFRMFDSATDLITAMKARASTETWDAGDWPNPTGREFVLSQSAGLRHAAGVLIETTGLGSGAQPDQDRIDQHRAVCEEALAYGLANDVIGTADEAGESKAEDGANGAPFDMRTTVLDPAPLAYELTAQQVNATALHRQVFNISISGDQVTMGQVAQPIIPYLLDGNAEIVVVAATPVFGASGPGGDGGLSQVSQAVIRTRLTWLSCNLSNGAVITELPDLVGNEVSRVIGEYTSANLGLPIPAVGGRDLTLSQRAHLAAISTEPARTMIVPVVNDVPTAGFIPLTRDLGTDATVALGCVSLEGYLRHRYVRDHLWEGVDPAEIARGVLADAEDIDGNGQGLNLIVDAPDVGLNAGRYFEAIDDETVYGALSELMDAGLIEWTIDVDWADGMAYRVVDKIARVRHRLGLSGDPTAVFQSATFSSQGASDARYTLKGEYSGDRYGNWIVARGTGEGEDKPRSSAQIDQGALDGGAPIWEQRIQPDIYRSPLFSEAQFNAYVQEQLLLHAQQELARIRRGGQTLEITARWDAPGARYGVDWSIGDDVLHELKGHAHPDGLHGVRRAIGFALSIQRGTIRPILQEEDA